MELRFRAPGHALPLSELLDRVLARGAGPESPSRGGSLQGLLREAVSKGRVGVGGTRVRHLGELVAPGASIAWQLDGELAESYRAALSGVDLDGASADGTILDLEVLVPEPPWHRGVLDVGRDEARRALHFEVIETRSGVSALRLRSSSRAAEGNGTAEEALGADDALGPDETLTCLAEAGMPVLGDLERGGVCIEGGRRVRRHARGAESDDASALGWWPDEAVFAGADSLVRFAVSRQAARVLERGHPWLLRDAESDDPERFAPGTAVLVTDPKDRAVGLAHIEAGPRVAARMWALGAERMRDAGSVEARIAGALRRRRTLLAPSEGTPPTDAYRLVHGEGDGLPGLAIDRLGPVLRVIVSGRACDGTRERAVDAVVRSLADQMPPDPAVVEVLHLLPRPTGRVECVRVVRGDPSAFTDAGAGGKLRVVERGMRFWVDAGLGSPERSSPAVGLFMDQRDNRERLSRLAEGGGRWLNLFAHTGAFSAVLLGAGAAEVVSVDLSAAYLRWLEENLELNGLATGLHRSVRSDGRRFLEGVAPESYDGIVLDPPTAASGGRGFWSVKKDLAPMLLAALRGLRPGGALLASRNDHRARKSIASLIGDVAREGGIALASVADAPAGVDYPGLRGFAEGDAHNAALAIRAR